jgi:hypothetical protein
VNTDPLANAQYSGFVRGCACGMVYGRRLALRETVRSAALGLSAMGISYVLQGLYR